MQPTLLTDNCVYPESPRWRDGLLWFSDVHDYSVKTIDSAGTVQSVVAVPGRPAGLGFLPDGRLLIAGALDRRLWTWDGRSLQLLADLSGLTLGLLNDMVVDGNGRAFVGDTGFNLMAGEPRRPGQVILVDTQQRQVEPRVVARDVWFPNGAVVSDDLEHYWVAETAAERVSHYDVAVTGSLSGRRTVIDLPDIPDGMCLGSDGDLWVALLRRGEFWRVRQDGSVQDKISADGRLAVACIFGGEHRGSLFLCSAATTLEALAEGRSAGLVHVLTGSASGAGFP